MGVILRKVGRAPPTTNYSSITSSSFVNARPKRCSIRMKTSNLGQQYQKTDRAHRQRCLHLSLIQALGVDIAREQAKYVRGKFARLCYAALQNFQSCPTFQRFSYDRSQLEHSFSSGMCSRSCLSLSGYSHSICIPTITIPGPQIFGNLILESLSCNSWPSCYVERGRNLLNDPEECPPALGVNYLGRRHIS